MLKVAVVDDNQNLRQSILTRLKKQNEITIVFDANSGNDCLHKMSLLTDDQQPEVILMDIEMDNMDGIECTQNIHKKYPFVQIIMLTVFDNDEKILASIQAGANGYLLKDEKTSVIVQSLFDVKNGGSQMSPAIARKALQLLTQVQLKPKVNKDESPILSKRELEILQLITEGYPNPQIADKLFISYETVRKHVRNIYEKLQVNNKIEASRIALEKNWFK